MRNGQLKPTYNVQIAVNSEYITGIEAFNNRANYGTLEPFLKEAATPAQKEGHFRRFTKALTKTTLYPHYTDVKVAPAVPGECNAAL